MRRVLRAAGILVAVGLGIGAPLGQPSPLSDGAARGAIPGCSSTPSTGCRVSDRSVLLLRRAAISRLLWRWTREQDAAVLDFGDPRLVGNDYTLCIYDSSAGAPLLASSASVAGGATCNGGPCWKALGAKGFRYRDRDGGADGITRILLRAGGAEGTKILVKGKGANLPLPTPAGQNALLLQDPQVTLQLVNSAGICWQAVYPSPAEKLAADEFRDEAGPPPPTSTPPPAPVCGDGRAEGSEECDSPDDRACPGHCSAAGTAGECTCPRPLSCDQVSQPPDSCTVDADCPSTYACVEGECRAGSCLVKSDCPAFGQCAHAGSSSEGTCICRGCGPWDCPLGCSVGGIFSGCLCESVDDCPPEDDVCFRGICS